MKRLNVLALITVMLSALLMAMLVRGATTMDYGDFVLSGGFISGHFPHEWDITACDLSLSFTYDASGLVDDMGGSAHAWAELGVRAVGYGNFNPTWQVEGAGAWLATDYDWAANTFNPDPPNAPTQDIDDKLILQKGGGMDEGSYNLPSTPPNPWANHAVWFDRDGVDQWQALMWGAKDGKTYNTNGLYDVEIILHANSATSGTAYMTVNGEDQGFYVPGWHAGPPDLYPAGMTFSADMVHMQVFYGIYGYGATHSVAFNDIAVQGCLYQVPATVNIDPDTLNLKSKGNWITAYVTLPAGYSLNDIDLSSVKLNGVPADWGEVQGDILMVKFDRQAFSTLPTGYVTLTMTGTINGQPFTGSDTMRVISK